MRGGLAGIATAALALARLGETVGRLHGADNIERYIRRHGRSRRTGSFDPRLNRHTGQPHEHAGEKARRARAAERVAANRAARLDANVYGRAYRNNGVAGLTRRGGLTW